MLLCASNGEIFENNDTKFLRVRNQLKKGYPEDVRLKKIAAHCALAAQSGQYNYERLIKRGETGAAQLAVFEFVKNIISVIYLLNNKYEPFYKWVYKGLGKLEILGDYGDALAGLTELDNSKEFVKTKLEIIEDVSVMVTEELKNQQISKAACNNLDTHAFSVQDHIKDVNLRNMHIMQGV